MSGGDSGTEPFVGPHLVPAASGVAVTLVSQRFGAEQVPQLRHEVRRRATEAGLIGDTLDDFVLAVHELVTNAVLHGGGSGHLHLRCEDATLTCEITDNGPGVGDPAAAAAAGLPAWDEPGGRGLWLASQLTDRLVLSHRSNGLTASVATRI